MRTKSARTVDEYIDSQPQRVQRLLKSMRSTVRKAAPDAAETISYGIPAMRGKKVLVWYGAHANHIGFYPGASGIATFKGDLARFKFAKGSVQFPFEKPLPLALVARIVKFRVREQSAPVKKKP